MSFARVRQRALELAQQGLEQLMADEGRAARLTAAVGVLQRARARAQAARRVALHQLNLASRDDLRQVERAVGRLTGRLEALDRRLARQAQAATAVGEQGRNGVDTLGAPVASGRVPSA